MRDQTPEQKQADKELGEAIKNQARAYGQQGLLMDWVVITSHHADDGNGNTYTGIDWSTSPDLPYYRNLGLLEFVRERIHDDIREQLEND